MTEVKKPRCFGTCNQECWATWKYEGLDCFHECFEEMKRRGNLPK